MFYGLAESNYANASVHMHVHIYLCASLERAVRTREGAGERRDDVRVEEEGGGRRSEREMREEIRKTAGKPTPRRCCSTSCTHTTLQRGEETEGGRR